MAFSFPNIIQKIKSLTGESELSAVGIDIGSSSAKVVQVRVSRGKAILETYGEIALSPYAEMPVGKVVKLSNDQIITALTDLIKEANVTAKDAGVSIPFASSLISILDMPKVGKEQLKRMMPIEARKYIPVPVSEVMLDWFVIPEPEAEEDAFDRAEKKTMMQKRGQEVLLVAIHNETLQNYQTIMRSIGVNVGFFEIEIFSAIRSSLGHGAVPNMVIDMGAGTTKIYVVERGVVRMSHIINVGSQHMTDTLARIMNWDFEKAERIKRESGLRMQDAYSTNENEQMQKALLSTLDRIFNEANRVLLSYGKRYNKHVPRAVMVGGGASLPGLAKVASKSLNTDVEIAKPFEQVESPAFLSEVLQSIGPGFAIALGVALRRLQYSG